MQAAWFALLLLIAQGLGWLVPLGPDRPGLRLMVGGLMVPTLLFWLAVVLPLPLSGAAAVIAAAAAFGWLAAARSSQWRTLTIWHPTLVLGGVIFVVTAVHGPFRYLVASWDDYANWLHLAQTLFIADDYRLPVLDGTFKRDYIPGWPLTLAFAALLDGRFDDGRAVLAMAVLHLGLLGGVFDVVRMGAERSPRPAVAGWLAVAALLAAEAAWRLLPSLVWVELGQVYALGAALVALVMASRDRDWRPEWAVVAGLAVAAATLFKHATVVAAAPALGLGFLMVALPGRRRGVPRRDLAVLAWYAALPAATLLAWSWVRPPAAAGVCVTDLSAILASGAAALAGSPALGTAGRVLAASATVTAEYKLAVTAAAVAGLGGGVLAMPALRPLAAAVAALVVLYVGGVAWVYVACADDFNFFLSSLERYLQVPLRTVHIAGLLAGGLAAVHLLGHRLRGRAAGMAAMAVVVVVGAEALSVHRSIRAMDDGGGGATAHHRELLLGIGGQVGALTDWARELGVAAPKVLHVYRAPDHFATVLAEHHARPRLRPADGAAALAALPGFEAVWKERDIAARLSGDLAGHDFIWLMDRAAGGAAPFPVACEGAVAVELAAGRPTGRCRSLGPFLPRD